MYSFRPSDFDPAAIAILPPYLALLPSQLRDADGFYIYREPRTGRTLRLESALQLGIVAMLGSHPGLVDIVTVDGALSEGAPTWAVAMLDRLDGDTSPHLLARMIVGNRTFDQAITGVEDPEDATPKRREAMRRAYRERGCIWSQVTERDLDPFLASAWLWVGETVRRGPPAAALQAVATSLHDADRSATVSDVMLDAAIAAGVPLGTATDALGCLIARGEIDVDLAAGIVCSDRPLARASGLYPGQILDAWRVSATAATNRQALATA